MIEPDNIKPKKPATRSAKKQSSGGKTEAQIREARLKAALKSNIARRKSQAKARANQDVSGEGVDE